MSDDPKFVKLANRLVRGSQTDLSSGFSLAGLDIVPFPKDAAQQAHVRLGVRRGVYESASDAEVKAFKDRNADYAEAAGNQPVTALSHQEGAVQKAAEKDRLEIEGSRGLGTESVAAFAADQARRDAVLEAGGGKTSKKGDKATQEAVKKAEEEAAAVAEAAKAEALAAAANAKPGAGGANAPAL